MLKINSYYLLILSALFFNSANVLHAAFDNGQYNGKKDHIKKTKQGIKCTGHLSEITALSWSPEGNFVISASNDKSIRIWDAKNGIQKERVINEKGAVCSVSWAPDGKSIVYSTKKGAVISWNVTADISLNKGTLKGYMKFGHEYESISTVGWVWRKNRNEWCNVLQRSKRRYYVI